MFIRMEKPTLVGGRWRDVGDAFECHDDAGRRLVSMGFARQAVVIDGEATRAAAELASIDPAETADASPRARPRRAS